MQGIETATAALAGVAVAVLVFVVASRVTGAKANYVNMAAIAVAVVVATVLRAAWQMSDVVYAVVLGAVAALSMLIFQALARRRGSGDSSRHTR